MKYNAKKVFVTTGLTCCILGAGQAISAPPNGPDGAPGEPSATSSQALGMPEPGQGEPREDVRSEGRGQLVKDAWLRGKIEVVLTLNRHLNPFDINTEVTDGAVTLSGQVESTIDKELAGELVKSIEGIGSVDNQLTVNPDTKAAGDNKSPNDWRQSVSDMTTSAIVKTKLLANSGTEGLAIRVTTRNAVIILEGDVKMDQEKDLAELIAKNTEGVEAVHNRLRLKGS